MQFSEESRKPQIQLRPITPPTNPVRDDYFLVYKGMVNTVRISRLSRPIRVKLWIQD